MRLSSDELMFINGVTKGEAPFGIFFKYPTADKMEGYKKRVIKSLQEKQILDDKQKFTKEGIALLLLWETYRNCKDHLVINHMFLSISSNRRVIGIVRHNGGYELISTDSAVIMLALLKKYEFLRLAHTEVNYHMEKMPYEDWAKEMDQYGDNVVVIGVYRGRSPEKEEVYYWSGDKGYWYDITTGYKRMISPRSMRLKLLRHLGMIKEQCNG